MRRSNYQVSTSHQHKDRHESCTRRIRSHPSPIHCHLTLCLSMIYASWIASIMITKLQNRLLENAPSSEIELISLPLLSSLSSPQNFSHLPLLNLWKDPIRNRSFKSKDERSSLCRFREQRACRKSCKRSQWLPSLWQRNGQYFKQRWTLITNRWFNRGVLCYEFAESWSLNSALLLSSPFLLSNTASCLC